MKKRLIAGTAAALLAAVLFLPVRVQAISAEKAILLDALSGRVIYEKSADSRSLIASTTKIMTALVADSKGSGGHRRLLHVSAGGGSAYHPGIALRADAAQR